MQTFIPITIVNAKIFGKLTILCLSCLLWLGIASCSTTQAIATESPAQQDTSSFPSWTGGLENPTVQKIIDFVTVDAAGIEPEDRIAVFDNDGTLWSEYPLIPGEFIEEHGDGAGDTTDDYIEAAGEFLTGENDEFEYPYVGRIYKPMKELLEYLQDNDFQTYICSGGDIDFVRAISEEYYHIPPEQVIGSTVGLTFDNDYIPSVLVRSPILNEEETSIQEEPVLDEGFFLNDSETKPVSIERYIGKRPIMAVGNSNGDLEMLEYTDDEQGPALMMLVRHDDEAREGYAEEEGDPADCDAKGVSTSPGSYCHANDSLEEADSESDWYLISVANDFNEIFLENEAP